MTQVFKAYSLIRWITFLLNLEWGVKTNNV